MTSKSGEVEPAELLNRQQAAVESSREGSRFGRVAGALKRIDVRVWLSILAVLVLVFLYRERGQLRGIDIVLRSASLSWMLAMFGVATLLQLLMAVNYAQLLRRLGHRVPVSHLLDLLLRRFALSAVVPGGAAPAVAVFARTLQKRNVPADDTFIATGLFGVLGHLSFSLLMVPVIAYLASRDDLPSSVAIGAVLLAIIVLTVTGLATAILRGTALPQALDRRLPERVRTFLTRIRALGLRPRALAVPFALALAVDGAGVVMLWTSLRAVGERTGLGVAAAGYGVGTLFLLLAPVFAGLGVVELSMAVALERLGVPKADALAATLLFRTGELWLPLFAGTALQARTAPRARAAPARMPALVALATGVLSVLSVLAPRLPRHLDRFERYSRWAPSDASRTFTLIAGFTLIYLSFALWRRNRAAWLGAVAISAAAVISHVGKRHDQSIAIPAAITLVLLLAYHRSFRVRSDVPTLRRGIAQLAGALVLALAYGTLGFWLLDRREFGTNFTLDSSFSHSLRLFFALSTPDLVPHTRYARWFLDSFTVVGAMAVVLAVIAVARPVVWRRRTQPHEHEQARRLVERHGNSSLDHFKTSEDKIVFLSSNHHGFVGYGLSGGTAIALGDPVATDEAEFHRVLVEFLDFCDANGWRVAFHQVSPRFLPEYRDEGLSWLKIGEEAVVDLTSFTLTGHAMKGLRGAVNKLNREGYHVVHHEPPHDDAFLASLHDVSNAWLTLGGHRERRFTLGHWDAIAVGATAVSTLEDATGRIFAFANWIPDGVAGEATLDLMRHAGVGPNGMMEVLFVGMFERAKDLGFERFSLGMVPFETVGRDPGSPALERGIKLLGEHSGRFFSATGLREFKQKFGPEWSPRYFVYHSELSLPAVALALIRITE